MRVRAGRAHVAAAARPTAAASRAVGDGGDEYLVPARRGDHRGRAVRGRGRRDGLRAAAVKAASHAESFCPTCRRRALVRRDVRRRWRGGGDPRRVRRSERAADGLADGRDGVIADARAAGAVSAVGITRTDVAFPAAR